MNKAQVIDFIGEVVVRDRFHCSHDICVSLDIITLKQFPESWVHTLVDFISCSLWPLYYESSLGNFPNAPYQVQVQFPLPNTDVTSSKMTDGSRNWTWTWYGALGKLPKRLMSDFAVTPFKVVHIVPITNKYRKYCQRESIADQNNSLFADILQPQMTALCLYL